MTNFSTKRLPQKPDVTAPDGSDVRILLELKSGGMAHFELPREKHPSPLPTAPSKKSGTSSADRAKCGANRATAKKSPPSPPA